MYSLKVKKIDLENNKKLRQKSKEEIECLSEINKFHKDVGTMDVNNLLNEKTNNRKKMQALFVEVILFCNLINTILKNLTCYFLEK